MSNPSLEIVAERARIIRVMLRMINDHDNNDGLYVQGYVDGIMDVILEISKDVWNG